MEYILKKVGDYKVWKRLGFVEEKMRRALTRFKRFEFLLLSARNLLNEKGMLDLYESLTWYFYHRGCTQEALDEIRKIYEDDVCFATSWTWKPISWPTWHELQSVVARSISIAGLR